MGMKRMNESKRLMKQHAIVLNVFSGDAQKVMLLDSTEGKIICYISGKILFVGAYIEYKLIKKRRHYVAYSVEVIRMPFALIKNDILFLHHVLEICHHFIPEGIVVSEVFDFINYLYKNEVLIAQSLTKKLYMSKLFVLFGIYPEKPYITHEYWNILLHEPIERIVHTSLDTTAEQALTIWLRSCIQIHPLVHTFRTLAFLNERE